jgi:hypothetical protein
VPLAGSRPSCSASASRSSALPPFRPSVQSPIHPTLWVIPPHLHSSTQRCGSFLLISTRPPNVVGHSSSSPLVHPTLWVTKTADSDVCGNENRLGGRGHRKPVFRFPRTWDLSESVSKNVWGAQILQTIQLCWPVSADIAVKCAQVSPNSRFVCTNVMEPSNCLQNRVARAHDGENG